MNTRVSYRVAQRHGERELHEDARQEQSPAEARLGLHGAYVQPAT